MILAVDPITVFKAILMVKNYWKQILVAAATLIFLILAVPAAIIAVFTPGGKDEDVTQYIVVSNELNLFWQDLITFDMVLHNNDLEGRDPNDSAKYFVELRYEEFVPATTTCVKYKKEQCIEWKDVPERIKRSEIIKGYKQITNFLNKYNEKSIKKVIDRINQGSNTRVIITTLSTEEAMIQAKFTKKQIDEFYDLQQTGILDELYSSFPNIGLIPGACINNVSPDGKAKVNATVEAYTSLIRKYATQYGIPQYVEIIKAMMMAESGGRGNDPMQASEGVYGSLSPSCAGKTGAARIGCIQDPEVSIHAGVLEFRDTINLADFDIAIAIQTYNFGKYFATWIKSNGGVYTVETAELYSRTVMAKAGQGLGTPTHAQKVLTQFYEHPGCTAGSISPEMIGANNWIWPTKSKRITDTFISTADFRYGEVHGAVDIGAVTPGVPGDPVWSMADGVVIQVGPITGGGRSVFIQHDNNVISRYIHLLSYNVNVGQKVTKGQIIGSMGGSGGTRTTIVDNAYAVHLDFQIKVNGEPVDPLQFFPNIK